MNRAIFFILFIGVKPFLFPQNLLNDSQLTAYLDVYYGYNFNKNTTNINLPFLYNHNRNREVSLNLGLIKYQYQTETLRANFAIQEGTYVQDNYSNEENLIKNIAEANVGIALNSSKKTWIDVGILPSHIGFESAISMDNLTLTRSVLAENSPYYMAGVKVNHQLNDKIEIAGLILNGWQRIKKVEGNSLPSFGTQLKYKITQNSILNWSTFIGTDEVDENRKMRYFNNLYTQIQWNEHWNTIANLDYGWQQKSKKSNDFNNWFGLALVQQFKYSNQVNFNFRLESFNDVNKVIIASENLKGWNLIGYSVGVDYSPFQNVVWRNEIRMLQNQDAYFTTNNEYTKKNFLLTSSISIKI